MKLYYSADTDSLYIDLDDRGSLVGIDIDRASQQFDLPQLEAASVPFEVATK